MAKLNPYLHFSGETRAAFEFYKECLGGEITLQAVGDSPGNTMPAEMKDKILHAMLKKDDLVIMGSDMSDQSQTKGIQVALSLDCGSKEEIETLFAKLSLGGKVGDPLTEAFFGTFGTLTDQFGIKWMFHFDKNKKT